MQVNFNQTADTMELLVIIEDDISKKTAYPTSASERYTFSLNHILQETKQVICAYMQTRNIVINLDITAIRGISNLSKFMLELTEVAIDAFYNTISDNTVQEFSKSVLIKTTINGKTKPRLYLAKNAKGKHNIKVLTSNASAPKDLKNITAIGNMKTLVWVDTPARIPEYIETLAKLMLNYGKCDMFVLDEDFVKEQLATTLRTKTDADIHYHPNSNSGNVLTNVAYELRSKDNKEPKFLDVTFGIIGNIGVEIFINDPHVPTVSQGMVVFEREFYSDARNILITDVIEMVRDHMRPGNNFKIYWTSTSTFTITGTRIDGSEYRLNLQISDKFAKTRMEYLVPMALLVAENIFRYVLMTTSTIDIDTCDTKAMDVAKTLLTMG